MDIKKLDLLRSQMEQKKRKWVPLWQNVQNYIMPERGHFSDNAPTPWTRKDVHIVNSTPAKAVETLAAGLHSCLSSPSRPWFRLSAATPDLNQITNVKLWVSDVQTRMYTVMSRSNFYNTLHSFYIELASYNTAAMYIGADYDDVIRCRLYTCGTYCVACDGNGRINTFSTTFYLTTIQMVEQYGLDNVNESVKTCYANGNYNQEFKVYWVVKPNEDRKGNSKVSQNKRWHSIHYQDGVNTENAKPLRVSGYDSFPFIVGRWETFGNEPYGIGTSTRIMGDAKQLQKMEEDKLLAIAKLSDPPLKAPSSMMSFIDATPGAITFYDEMGSAAGLGPLYETRPELAGLMNTIQAVEDRINRNMYADLFMLLTGQNNPQMTKAEVDVRYEEKLLGLGPVIERLHTESLSPAIDRVFFLMNEVGLIPEPPEEIAGSTMKVEYISLLAQAQKMVGVSGIERILAFIANVAQGDPTIMDKFDADEAVDQIADMVGVHPGIIRSDDVVKKMREQRAQQQAAMQQQEQLMAMTEGANKLSKAKLDDDNMLSQIVGGQPQ